MPLLPILIPPADPINSCYWCPGHIKISQDLYQAFIAKSEIKGIISPFVHCHQSVPVVCILNE